jgi:hypothetical protein
MVSARKQAKHSQQRVASNGKLLLRKPKFYQSCKAEEEEEEEDVIYLVNNTTCVSNQY